MENKKRKYISLGFISLTWLIIFIGRLTAPTLLVQITESLGVTDPQAGLALSGLWFMYGIMQFPPGFLSDSIGRKKVIIASLILFALATFLIGSTFNYYMMVFTFSLLGFAAGFLPSASLTMIAELFGPKKGKALGIRSAITSLSGLTPALLPLMAILLGWRNVFFLWGGIALIIGYLFYLFVEETLKEPVKKSNKKRFKIGLKSLVNSDTSFMFFINLIVSFAWIGMLSWFPTYMQKAKGFSPETAGILFSIVLIGGFLLKPLLGHLSDKINKIWIMLFLTVTATISLYLLTIFNSFLPLVFISFLFAQTGAFYPVRTSYLMDIWFSETAGTKLGVFRSGVILLGSPISAVIGWSKEIYGFNTSILLVAGAMFIGVVSLMVKLIVNRWHPKDKCWD